MMKSRKCNLSAEAAAQLREGINLVLSRWPDLQLAVKNKWGGGDDASIQKSQQLGHDIFHLLTSSDCICVKCVEQMIDKFMITSFRTELEYCSTVKTAEKVLALHKECSEGNFDSIRMLQEINTRSPQPRRNHKEANEIDDDYQVTEMNRNLTPDAAEQLYEGISLVLSRWSDLQLAVRNEWGGRDSIQISEQLGLDIFHLLTQSRDQVCIRDVQHMLGKCMLTSYRTILESFSTMKTAKEVMVMHKKCSEGNLAQ